MKTFKYNIGDFVTPVVMNGSAHATRMVIVCQITEHYRDHDEQWYICSHYKLGDYIRQKISEAELTPIA